MDDVSGDFLRFVGGDFLDDMSPLSTPVGKGPIFTKWGQI